MTKVTERCEVIGLLRGSDLIKMNVRIWEPEGSEKSLLCIHGFAGTGWDFTILARTLTKSGFTVIAPDIIGRGESSFLGQDKLYTLRNYVASINAAAQFEKKDHYHLGTSWGGIILLAYLATQRNSSKGIILNDIPIESDENLKRFREFLTQESTMSFLTFEEAAEHLISSRSMGFLEGTDRDDFINSRLMKIGDTWRMRYDPAVAAPFSNRGEFSLFELLCKLDVPTLMTFGNESPYVGSKRLADLKAANKNITFITDMDDPHPPSLMKLSQILQLAGFLAQCV